VVIDSQGLDKIEVFLNNNKFPNDEQKGIGVRSKNRRIDKERTLKLSLPLETGKNVIKILATNTVGAQAAKEIIAHRTEEMNDIYALVIGISDYHYIRDLTYAADDARAVKKYFIHDLGIPGKNVFSLINEEATVRAIRSLLGTTLPSKAGKKDTVFIYFGGHGASESNSASPDGDGLSKYLLAYDSVTTDLYGSALPMDEIARIFDRLRAERVLFLVDSCYSGASGGRTLSSSYKAITISGNFLARIAQGKGRVLLCASEPNEVAQESDKLKHGVFTYYLLDGMKGKADADKDGLVSVQEIYRYLTKRVPVQTRQTQHPIMKGEMEGLFILGRSQGLH
jgi:uncharacterized caspase-like protein